MKVPGGSMYGPAAAEYGEEGNRTNLHDPGACCVCAAAGGNLASVLPIQQSIGRQLISALPFPGGTHRWTRSGSQRVHGRGFPVEVRPDLQHGFRSRRSSATGTRRGMKRRGPGIPESPAGPVGTTPVDVRRVPYGSAAGLATATWVPASATRYIKRHRSGWPVRPPRGVLEEVGRDLQQQIPTWHLAAPHWSRSGASRGWPTLSCRVLGDQLSTAQVADHFDR